MKKLHALPVFLIYRGGFSFFFSLIVTVNLVYQVTTVGLNPLQLVLVGTMLELSAAIFEIPTGLVADVYGRRLSVIIGTVFIGLGFIIEGSFPVWGMVMFGQAVWGFGWTFISGALDAWIADEVGPERAGAAYLRGSQVGQAAGLIAILPSVLLAGVAIRLPIVLGGVLFIGLAGFMLLFMPEQGFTPTPPQERHTWRQMRATLGEGLALVRIRPILLTLLLVELFAGAHSEGFDRLWTPFLLNEITLPGVGTFGPVVWFGLISAVNGVLAITATEIVRRRLDLADQRLISRALLLFYGVIGVGTVAFAFSSTIALALGTFWLVSMVRAIAGPVFMAWLNQHIESEVRATVLSTAALANEVGQIGGGPAIGLIGTLASIRAALAVGGLLLLPAVGLLRRQVRQADLAQGGAPAGAEIPADRV
ncbi:MAG: MFS transporter [Anaerolineae bacterium]|nr:MFS transporter [Anaerolineae bacterium]